MLEATRKIAVIGLGYVGLPLAVGFSKALPTIGFDINRERVAALRNGNDENGDLTPEVLKNEGLLLTADEAALAGADFFVIAVPTPVDKAKRPDLGAVLAATRVVGRALATRKASVPPIVVYESTVYPGCTEEICRPLLEKESGLASGREFKLGYSPERINPGDTEHTLAKVIKVVSGEDAETTAKVARVYRLVAKAGVYCAPDIRTAEAAKVIENIQRDLNIALMNELSMLFHAMGIDTREVLAASKTKWNFLPFEPGLVGGHCIPEDPYYLTHKAQEIGFHPEVILAGRRTNDSMGIYVAHEIVRLLVKAHRPVHDARVLILGVAFKENVRDVRNSRVVDVVRELERTGLTVDVFDPVVGEEKTRKLGLRAVSDPFVSAAPYDAVVLAVPHKPLLEHGLNAILKLMPEQGTQAVLVDVKGALRMQVAAAARKPLYWTL